MAAVTLVVVAGFPQPACSQVDEYAVKAAYLFNFGRTDTSSGRTTSTGTDFVLGILGPSPFGRSLSAIDGKPLGNQTTKVRVFSSVRDLTPCQVLFVCGKDAKAQEALDRSAAGGQGPAHPGGRRMRGALERGAAIRFVEVEGAVRFEVNPAAAAGARLQMSAKLLRLAVRTLGGDPSDALKRAIQAADCRWRTWNPTTRWRCSASLA